MKRIYDTNKHSVFLLQYHLILVTKYRRKVISNENCQRLSDIFTQIGKKEQYKLEIVELNSDQDHLHILFRAEPKSEISKFLNAYKSASSRLVKKEFPEIREKLWEDAFWSRSFFLATTGGMTLEILKQFCSSCFFEY